MDSSDGKFCPHGFEISNSEYNDMMKRIKWLEALEAAGVDNWEGIDEAKEIYEETEWS